jgi:hypothetical protein
VQIHIGDGGSSMVAAVPAVVPVATFCVCGAPEAGLYVECAVGTSGCNGWVHPRCIGLSEEEAQQKSALVCPLCEFEERNKPKQRKQFKPSKTGAGGSIPSAKTIPNKKRQKSKNLIAPSGALPPSALPPSALPSRGTKRLVQQEWAACDECGQWRSLAMGAPAWGDKPFRCSMVTWSVFNACTIPEEAVDQLAVGQQQQFFPGATSTSQATGATSTVPSFEPRAPPSVPPVPLVTAPFDTTSLVPLPRGGDFECLICVEVHYTTLHYTTRWSCLYLPAPVPDNATAGEKLS